MRPHDMSWPSLKHTVEEESRHGNVQEPVFFYRAHWKQKDEGGREGERAFLFHFYHL